MEINENTFDVNDIKKNKVEDILTEGEKILVSLVPNRKVFMLESFFKGLPLALIWGVFDGIFISFIFSNNLYEQIGPFVVGIIFFFLIHLIPVWLYIGNIIKRLAGYKNINYYLTNKRIIVRSGIIGIDYKFLFYPDIATVNVKVGIFDRMFKVGDVYIRSATQAICLEDIDNPYQYSSRIQQVINDIKSDISFPNDLRPKENHGYNTDYKG